MIPQNDVKIKVIDEIHNANNCILYRTIECSDSEYTSYGISIHSNAFGKQENACVYDISDRRDDVLELMFLLADNIVFPSVLLETVEDYIAAVHSL